jgi:hypothetical protein
MALDALGLMTRFSS